MFESNSNFKNDNLQEWWKMKKHKIHLLPVPKKIANCYQQPVVSIGNGFMDGYKHLEDIFLNMLTKEKAKGHSKTDKTILIQGIPEFLDFTILDPRYFVILFEAKFHDFEEKNKKK